MSNTIQVRRGAKAFLPTLNSGEFGFCTDTNELFIGDGAANHEVAMASLSLQADGSVSLTDDWDVDGAGTLFVDKTNGRVGIGTASPGVRLEIEGGHASLSNDNYLHFKTNAGATSDCYIGRYPGNAMIIMFDQNNLRVIAKDGNNVRIEDSALTERIRLSPEGDSFFNVSGHNLGIGTSTPSTKLEVAGISTSYVATVTSGLGHAVYAGDGKAACFTVGTNAATFLFDDSGRFGIQARPRADVLAGSANRPDEKFTVLADGKVGIGVDTPHDALEINTTGEAAILSVITPAGGVYNSEVRIGEQTYDSSSSIYAGAVRYNTSNEFEFGTYDGTATFVRAFHIDRGSAYTFIDGTLELVGNSISDITNNPDTGREILQLRAKDTLTNGAGINLYGTSDSTHADEIRMFTSGTSTRLVIDASGRVGIGLSPTSNMAGLSIEAGVLTLKETTTPTADTDYGKIYPKSDNKIYFQDGAGTEHEIAFSSGGLPGYMTRGYFERATFRNSGRATGTPYTVFVGPGAYMCKDKYCYWTSELHTNAVSTPSANTWYYLYLDYSAITSGTEIVAGNLIWSSTAPTWNGTYRQWMNGDDRCIFACLTDAGPNYFIMFYHDGGDLVSFTYSLLCWSAGDVDTTWTDITMKMPAMSTKALAFFRARSGGSTTPATLYYQTKGNPDGSDGHVTCASSNTNYKNTFNTMPVITDSSQKIQIKYSISDTHTADVATEGWYFPTGM